MRKAIGTLYLLKTGLFWVKCFNKHTFHLFRALNSLYWMVGEPVISFSEEEFNQQFQIYMKELSKLLDADEGCRGKYKIVHYKDDGKLNFSKEIINQMKGIRYKNAEEYSTVNTPTKPSEDKIETDSSTDMERALKDMHSENEVLDEKDKNV